MKLRFGSYARTVSTMLEMIHISTDYVFDGLANKPYRECDAVGPTGVYGLSKLAGENAIREILRHHIIFRTSWVFGLNGHNFVRTMLRLAENNSELGVVRTLAHRHQPYYCGGDCRVSFAIIKSTAI